MKKSQNIGTKSTFIPFFFKWGLKARKYFLKTIFHERQTFFHCLRKGSLGLAGLVQGLTLPHKSIRIRKFYSILFYHFKKPLYQL